MNTLLLSIFPGIGLLDRAFEEAGFCVVRGPDPLWGGDVRKFHPPSCVFGGVIGGDPCQSHSRLANLVRAKGLEPSFPDMTPEFERVVEEAQPEWFLRENVPQAPDLLPAGYAVSDFFLNNAWLGEAQMRKRRFWFGQRGVVNAVNLRKYIAGVALELPETVNAVAGDPRTVFIPGGQAEVDAIRRSKATTVGGRQGHVDDLNVYRKAKEHSVTGRHTSKGMGSAHAGNPPSRTLAEMCELQGLPIDYMDHQPWTMAAKRKMIGNGVPLAMGRELARAVKLALGMR